MFAFFGLGTQELMILGMLGVIGVGVAVVVMVVSRSSRPNHQSELEEENRRLRDELNRRDEKP